MDLPHTTGLDSTVLVHWLSFNGRKATKCLTRVAKCVEGKGAILMLGKTVGKLSGGQSNIVYVAPSTEHRVFKRVHINLQTRTITGLQPAQKQAGRLSLV